MKKFIFLLFIFFIPFLTFSQKEQTYLHNNNKNEIVFVDQQPWLLENEGQWGSFYWKVIRTETKVDNYYWYYVYFYSNSLLRDSYGTIHKAVTYISDLNIIMYQKYNGQFYSKTVPFTYIICDYEVGTYKAWFSSINPYNTFKITYSGVSAYSYSKFK